MKKNKQTEVPAERCGLVRRIATGGIHDSNCPHNPGYVSDEERVEQLEQQLETERECRLANEAQLHKADAELGRLREQVRALSRIVRRTLACGQLEKLEDAKPHLDDA